MRTLFLYLLISISSLPIFAQWTALDSALVPANYHSNQIKIAPDGSVWDISGVNAFPATGTSPVVNRSTDGGLTWTTDTVLSIPDTWPYTISPLDSMHAWMSADRMGLYFTDDGGQTWNQDTSINFAVPLVHFFDSNNGWAYTYDTTTFVVNASITSDGGQTWTHINTASSNNPAGTSVPTYDSTEFQGYFSWATGSGYDVIGDTIVIGTNKGYWMSQDRGYNWTRHFSPLQGLNYLPVTIAVKDAQTVMIVTDYDTTFSFGQPTASFTTRDGGQTWTQGTPALAVAGLSYIPGTAGTFVLGSLVATGGGVGTAITYDMGNNWYTIDNTTSIGTLDFLNDSVGYAASANGPFGSNNLGQIFKWDFDCLVLRDTVQLAVCKSYTLPSNGLTYEAPGMYDVVLNSSFGCDSIVTLDLTSTGPSTLVNQNGSTLIAEDIPSNTTHQWLRCDQNFSPIAGATVTIYTATESGQYAVEVNSAGCVDTSDCFLVCFPSTESIVKKEDTLSVESGATSYQWLDCNNDNAPINGATAESFVPSTSGTFAVTITSAIGCVDTLPCVNLFLTDIDQLRAEDFQLSPNPAKEQLRISIPPSLRNSSLDILILDMSGRVMMRERDIYSEGEAKFDTRALASGIYMLQVRDEDESVLKRFVKR